VTRLLVLRHAPTDWNAAGLIQGRADRPLSEIGRQIAQTWRLPEDWAGARCFCSPLRRAVETARLLALDPEIEPRLTEMDWGEWEGHRLADLRRGLGEAMAQNEAAGLDFRPAGGESPREVRERILPLLSELSGPTIAVTHKGVLRALYSLATGWTMRAKPEHRLLDGCAQIFSVERDANPSIELLNIPLERRP
jgi:probable phosphoglycerate mutase